MSEMIFSEPSGSLELRAQGDGSTKLIGSFPYRKRAVISDGGRRGRPQKEEFDESAFAFRVDDPASEIHFLVGHSYDRPLASKLNGSLKLRDTAAALLFEAIISPAIAQTSYGRDALALLSAGLAVGISPGFRMPPERAVPREKAEEIIQEPVDPDKGMHGAFIRLIKQALLFELSIVTSPAYKEARVEKRDAEIIPFPKPALATALHRWRP